MAITGSSQTSQEKGAKKIRKGVAPRIQRDNDRDPVSDGTRHDAMTRQESRDRDEHRHFHAADAQDIARSQSSARVQKREKDREDKGWGDHAAGRAYSHSDYSHYNDDSRAYQSFSDAGGNRSAHQRYEQMGHGANRRPDDRRDDPVSEDERYALNDRQNGWQANVRVDNRGDDRRDPDDDRFHNNWRDRQWRETAYRGHDRMSDEWRPNDDRRNERRNGSEYGRDRDSYGNSRFRDDDYGYRTSLHEDRDYGHEDERNDPRQPRGYSATSERDFEDRNPSREWARDRAYTGRGPHR